MDEIREILEANPDIAQINSEVERSAMYTKKWKVYDLFLSQIDIDKQNVFTIDGTIPKEAVIEYCRLYEQRIQTFGGIDIVLMGIGREGNRCV